MFQNKLCMVALTRLLSSLSEHSSQPGFPHCLMNDTEPGWRQTQRRPRRKADWWKGQQAPFFSHSWLWRRLAMSSPPSPSTSHLDWMEIDDWTALLCRRLFVCPPISSKQRSEVERWASYLQQNCTTDCIHFHYLALTFTKQLYKWRSTLILLL